jgi:hypothetical protein
VTEDILTGGALTEVFSLRAGRIDFNHFPEPRFSGNWELGTENWERQ